MLLAEGGLFEIDLNTGAVISSDSNHSPCQISADGKTIAVSDIAFSGEIGLSFDAGLSFEWTRPGGLIRCQDSKLVATGKAMLVSCISGVDRWTGGIDPPAPISYVVPSLLGDARRVVIGTPEAIYQSDDSGTMFVKHATSGVVTDAEVVAVVGETIYATGRAADFKPTLYAAQWSGAFYPVTENLPLSAASQFDSKEGVLTVLDGTRMFVRRTPHSTFAEIGLPLLGGTDAAGKIVEVHYAYGSLYVMSEAPSLTPGGRVEIVVHVVPLPEA